MELRLIGRGTLSGAVAGLLAFVVARIFAEPLIQSSIDYESGRDAAQAVLDRAAGLPVATEGPEVFSRTVQADVGIAVGLVLFGAAMGALVAVAFAVCLGRTGTVRPRPLALLVAAAGFVSAYLVPFAKYPANPPAIGHEATIRDRGALYLVLVAASVLAMFLAVYFGQKIRPRLGTWNASLLMGLGYLVVMGVLFVVLPAVGHLQANLAEYGRQATETPLPLTDAAGTIVYPGFPADVLARFRFYSVLDQLLLWSVIGVLFAPLAERVVRPGAPVASDGTTVEPEPREVTL